MKIFKSGEVIRAVDINANFAKAIKTDLSNCPIIPCNKGRNRKNWLFNCICW